MQQAQLQHFLPIPAPAPQHSLPIPAARSTALSPNSGSSLRSTLSRFRQLAPQHSLPIPAARSTALSPDSNEPPSRSACALQRSPTLYAFFRFGSCARIIAANISTHPDSSRALSFWPSSTHPASTDTTDSRLRISDATVGSVSFCPMI